MLIQPNRVWLFYCAELSNEKEESQFAIQHEMLFISIGIYKNSLRRIQIDYGYGNTKMGPVHTGISMRSELVVDN